jgi:hypothetical protein
LLQQSEYSGLQNPKGTTFCNQSFPFAVAPFVNTKSILIVVYFVVVFSIDTRSTFITLNLSLILLRIVKMAAPQEQIPVETVPAATPAAAPAAAPAATPAKQGPIDQKDVDGWKSRFNDALANTDKITAPAATDARPWHAGLFECFNPIDTCMALLEQDFPHVNTNSLQV